MIMFPAPIVKTAQRLFEHQYGACGTVMTVESGCSDLDLRLAA